jgi:SHS2 domain-containing protein
LTRVNRHWATDGYSEILEQLNGAMRSMSGPETMAKNGTQSEARGSWEHFPHGADIGVRGTGPTLSAAFAQAAMAMTAVITEPEKVVAREAVEIACEATSPDLLFIDWLNALVFEMATRDLLFGTFDVTIEGEKLKATASGEPVDRARHEPAAEIKGATFTELKVVQDPDGNWTAQCVVDV